jgi:hypothetical protein
MKMYVKQVASALLLVFVVAGVAMYGPSAVRAEEKGLAQQLQGTWTLASIYNELDGKKSDVFGLNPRGSMIFTSNGRFSLIIMKESLPKFAANSRVKGTAEENQAVVQGSVALFGSYKVDSEKSDTVILRIEGSTFPNWDAQDQKRIAKFTGDGMDFITPAAAIGGTNYAVWKKVK